MADEAQVIYEYSVGASISFKTNNLSITYKRLFMTVTSRSDGKIYVDDPAKPQRIFSCTSIITGSVMNTLNTVQTASITYDATYPRLTTINLATGTSALTNIEVVLTDLKATDLGNGQWSVDVSFAERVL